MKTLYFCNLRPLKTGAFERFLEELAGVFQRAGDELLLVLAGEPIAPVATAWRRAGLRWRVLPGWCHANGAPRAWGWVVPALTLLRQERPEIAAMHFGNELPTLAAALLAPLWGAPGVRWVWEQDQQIADPSPLAVRLNRMRALALRCDRFVAVYEGGRRSMRLRGVPDGRIVVIHNAVGAHTQARAPGWARGEFVIPARVPLLLSVGSLIPRKRNAFLIEALAAADPAAHLILVGDGPERAALTRQAARLGVAERLHLAGLRNDVRDLQSEADLYLHASLAETCTYAVTESMAAGIPAVVTEAGAAREQIEDGVSGHVVARDDLAGFVAAVRSLLADPARRARMGAAARARWAAHFRVEDQARAYHRLYRELTKPVRMCK